MAIPYEESEFTFNNPTSAIDHWLERTNQITTIETLPLPNAQGRILAQDILSDRPSPPCTVSAMDGYVFPSAELIKPGHRSVAGEIAIGQPPPDLPANQTLRIVTGAPLPPDCHVVIKREDVQEFSDHITIPEAIATSVRNGQNVRYQGENAPARSIIVPAGTLINMPVAAALAGFGYAEVKVFTPLKMTILTTGDELRNVEDRKLDPWEIRNSNGPTLQHFFTRQPWIDVHTITGVVDNFEATCAAFEAALQNSDAIIATGGVSMGDHDYVPAALRAVGGEIVFHKLPVRPGKPILAAIGPAGQIIAGLPGNPVSVMIAARRITYPILQKKAGLTPPASAQPLLSLTEPMNQPLHLFWYRPVKIVENGRAEIVPMKGSGDFGATARSDGFIEIPPRETHPGPWPYWSWLAD